MFTPIKYDKALEYPKMAASITITKGNALVDDGNGLLTNATDAATEIRFVAAETKTTWAWENPTVACYYTDGIEFLADTDANPAQTDVFTKCDLATVSKLNPDASSNDVFFITWIKWALADKQVTWRFVMKIA